MIMYEVVMLALKGFVLFHMKLTSGARNSTGQNKK